MSEALDKLVAQGEARGKQIGKEIGKILAYADMGLSAEEIAKKVGKTEDEVINILQEQESK